MLCIKQLWDHVTNKSLYQLTGPLHENIRKRQLKFTGHCIRMLTDESANCVFIYESKIKSSLWPAKEDMSKSNIVQHSTFWHWMPTKYERWRWYIYEEQTFCRVYEEKASEPIFSVMMMNDDENNNDADMRSYKYSNYKWGICMK